MIRCCACSGICVIAMVTMSGCGSDPPTSQPLVPAVRQAQVAPPVPVKLPGRRRAEKPPEPKPELPPPPTDGIPPGTDPNDVFDFDPEPKFDVLGPEPKVKPADQFAAVAPERGSDSTSFVIVEPGESPPPGQALPNFNLPAGFAPLVDAGYSQTGLPRRIRCEKDNSVMALIPGGPSLVGSHAGAENTRPELTVRLSPFYVDVHEVTVGQFAAFLNDRKQSRRQILNSKAPSDHPALGASWGDARGFAIWAGKDLPTEAQWEKAARGVEGYNHPRGNGRAIWERRRTARQIETVRSFRTDASPYGVFDMAGNAREWCRDWYYSDAFQRAVATRKPLNDWKGPRRASPQNLRVVKGNGPGWMLWHREGIAMRERPVDVGFRCVLEVSLPKAASATTSATDR